MTIQEILKDPATSRWLRDALTSALTRDPVDVQTDLEILCAVLGFGSLTYVNKTNEFSGRI
jgi:hypothetical protein